MASQNSKLLSSITTIASESAKNNTRTPSLDELTTIVAAINSIWDDTENRDSQLQQKLAQQIQYVLKCVPLWKNKKHHPNEVEDRLELFAELIEIVKRNQGKCMPDSMSQLLTQFSIKIVSPCLQSLKAKKISQILTSISSPSPVNRKGQICFVLPLGLLQALQDCGHPKIYAVLSEYCELLLQNKSATESELILKNMFQMLSNGEWSNMALKVLSATLDEYVKQFEKQYDGVSKSQVGKFENRVLGVLIRLIGNLGKSAQFVRLPTKSNQKQCNTCTIFGPPQASYLLQINNNSYQISVCSSCYKLSQANANPQAFILLQLAFNSEPLQEQDSKRVLQFKQTCEILQINSDIDGFTYCEHNKELKLGRQKITELIIFQAVFKKIWMKLWIMLMILSNHNESATRLKAVKTINEVHEFLYNLELNCHILANIKKCLLNRLLDTEYKIRLAALNVLISILPTTVKSFQTVVEAIEQQYIKPKPLHGNCHHSAKQIMEIMDRLRELGKDQRIRQHWVEEMKQFVVWLRIIVELAISYEAAHFRQSKRSSKSKTTRKQQFNESCNLVLSKYKQIISQFIKDQKKCGQDFQHFVAFIINPQLNDRRMSQQCYNTLINVVVQCGINSSVKACRKVLLDICKTMMGQGIWVYNQIQQLYWINSSILVEWMVEVSEGEFIRDLIHQILNRCEGQAQFKETMIKCKILAVILQTIELKNLLRFSAQTDREMLENLREFITTELIPEANSLPIQINLHVDDGDQYMEMLTSLLQCINHVLGDSGRYTLAIYESCWKYAKDCLGELSLPGRQEDDESQVRRNNRQKRNIILETVGMMLSMLPHMVKDHMKKNPQNSNLPFDTHFQDMYNCVKQIINQVQSDLEEDTEIMLKAARLMGKLLELCHNFIAQSQQLLICLFSVRSSYISNILLNAINVAVSKCECVRELQGIRDIAMYFINRVNCPEYSGLLNCPGLYAVGGQLYKKGVLNIHDINKLLIYGIVEDGSNGNPDTIRIKNTCLTILREISEDFFESRQLYSNFSENIKFILIHKNKSNQLFFPLSIIDSSVSLAKHPKLLSKAEQSQQALKPTLVKSLCEYLNKLMLGGKLLNPTTEINQEFELIFNSFMKCTTLAVDDFKTAIRCLMAIVDCIYFEVVQLIQAGKDGGNCSNILLTLMKVLSYFLNGNPFRNVNADVQKYFTINNGTLMLGKEIKMRKEKVELEQLQYLHDLIICGEDQERYDKQSDDSSTYDTSENRKISNSLKPKQTKTKIKKQGEGKVKKEKVTKKAVSRRNKTAPKSSLRDEFDQLQQPRGQEKEVTEYRMKLRSRQKIVQ